MHAVLCWWANKIIIMVKLRDMDHVDVLKWFITSEMLCLQFPFSQSCAE